MLIQSSVRYPVIEVVSQTPAGRLNEDTWLVMQGGPLGERIVLAAIDGATTRLTPPPLQRYLDTLPIRLTPAAYSARVIRDSLARLCAEGLFDDPRALLVEANADLGRALISLFGSLTLEGMCFPEDVYAPLAHDPRLVRLGLPVSVATLAEYDPAAHELQYAHVGDTLLLIVYEDGRVNIPMRAEDAVMDSDLKRTALRLREYYPDLSMRELLQQPEIRTMNLHNALHHNYVDEHGLPQPGQGIGALNGLPELRYFVQTGRVSMERVRLVCAMTDGLEWPASAQEVFTDDPDEAKKLQRDRRLFMGAQIADLGLRGYLSLLRQAEAADADHERYPRMKTHDDATGVLLGWTGVAYQTVV